MDNEKQEKIGKFKVGDLVRIKHKIIANATPEDKTSFDSKFILPIMVVSEVFIDEKASKSTYIGAGESHKKVKDLGTCIRVKCQWFYEGKCQEKIFWEHVLKRVK